MKKNIIIPIAIAIIILCSMPLVIMNFMSNDQTPISYVNYTMSDYDTLESVSSRYKPDNMSLQEYLGKVEIKSNLAQRPQQGTLISLPVYK